jgi:hypothetical protein
MLGYDPELTRMMTIRNKDSGRRNLIATSTDTGRDKLMVR